MSKVKELGNIIKKLHDGVDKELVKKEFEEKFGSVTSAEIVAMEQQLVEDGMPIAEIQKLCDIHADVFNMSIEEIHQVQAEHEKEGHPVKVLLDENRALENHLEEMFELVKSYEAEQKEEVRIALLTKSQELFDINKHYDRKEKAIFPLMEKYGISSPPQVMWGVDDEIREDLKSFHKDIQEKNYQDISNRFTALRKRMEDMILKEEKIMLPLITDLITEEEWLEIAYDSEEIGFCLVSPKEKWIPKSIKTSKEEDLRIKDEKIHFETGVLNVEQLMGILDALPVDVTFIDKDDKFRYFNQADGRIFVRSKSALGRLVHHCHPPRSVNMVEEILSDLKSGKKDSESFWIELQGMLVYISYKAVRNKDGEYLGTLETSYDIKPYRELQGEKRLI
ncbi:MAG: DUF438 domain-containing protein [Saccharofermentanales bacterium]|jgi:DUF438 domain-containing protein